MSQSVEDSTILTTYKKMFGLSNVNNTSDENKALNNAENAKLNNKLDLIGGTLTGTLNGTNALFTDDLTSNTSNTPIKMIQMLRLMESLQTGISTVSSSKLYITITSQFPIKIPYSSSTIDQTNVPGSTTYSFADSFRPIGMTIVDYPTTIRFDGAWAIKYNTVDKDVWSNNWTVVIRLWFSVNVNDIIIKIGEKWDRWISGKEGYDNYGDKRVPPSDTNIPTENIYIHIGRPTKPSNEQGILLSYQNMDIPANNNLNNLIPHWSNSEKGVYIVISHDQTNKFTTINYCDSDGTSYYIIKSNITPTMNRRPFHIFTNGGLPIWTYGILLINDNDKTLINYINIFKNQFGLS